MAENVLDVVAVNPEEPHVPDQVHPAAMQKHGGKQIQWPQCIRHETVAGNEVVEGVRLQ